MKPDLILTKSQVEGPIVYRFWLKEECIYIGSSAVGLCRPLSHSHGVRAHDGFDYDRVEVFKYNTAEEALRVEEAWIEEIRPKFNVQLKPLEPRPKNQNKITGKFEKSSWRNKTQKSRDETSGEFLVVDDAGKALFRSHEKFERDRFHAQERKRIAIAERLKD
jgi:excinuclease UvrABC nuclease subunit